MFETVYEPVGWMAFTRVGIGILLTALVVKMMDDFMDLRYEINEGRDGLAVRLGEGTLPYALMLFAFAALIETNTSIALMISAYAIGMAGEMKRILPSGLAGWHEGVIVIVAGLLVIPWSDMLWALGSVTFVQVIDDWADYHTDRLTGNPNLIRRFGAVETSIVGLVAIVIACALRPFSTVIVLVSVPIVLHFNEKLARPLRLYKGWRSS